MPARPQPIALHSAERAVQLWASLLIHRRSDPWGYPSVSDVLSTPVDIDDGAVVPDPPLRQADAPPAKVLVASSQEYDATPHKYVRRIKRGPDQAFVAAAADVTTALARAAPPAWVYDWLLWRFPSVGRYAGPCAGVSATTPDLARAWAEERGAALIVGQMAAEDRRVVQAVAPLVWRTHRAVWSAIQEVCR